MGWGAFAQGSSVAETRSASGKAENQALPGCTVRMVSHERPYNVIAVKR